MLGVPCSLCTSKGGIDQGGHTQVVRMYTDKLGELIQCNFSSAQNQLYTKLPLFE